MLNFKITNNYSIELKWFMYTEKKMFWMSNNKNKWDCTHVSQLKKEKSRVQMYINYNSPRFLLTRVIT